MDPIREIDEVADDIWQDVKAVALWVYNWITVIATVIAGALAFLPDVLNQVFAMMDAAGIVDFTVFGISKETAAAITFAVGAAKGLLAYYNSRKASKAA